jgi:hypothetical protein
VPGSGGGRGQWLKSLWIWEVWLAIRPTFIRLIADAALFLVLMAILAFGHYVIENLTASEERRALLENFHFYVVLGAWVFFSGVLFIELGAAFLKRMQDHFKH